MPGEREERRSGENDRREDLVKLSPWQSPGLWVSILGFLLSLSVVVGGVVSKQLADLHSDMTALTISTTRTNTQQAAEIKQLQDELHEEKEKRDKESGDQSAYNYDLSGKLIRIQTRIEDGKP
jgi:hypothetical protein